MTIILIGVIAFLLIYYGLFRLTVFHTRKTQWNVTTKVHHAGLIEIMFEGYDPSWNFRLVLVKSKPGRPPGPLTFNPYTDVRTYTKVCNSWPYRNPIDEIGSELIRCWLIDPFVQNRVRYRKDLTLMFHFLGIRTWVEIPYLKEFYSNCTLLDFSLRRREVIAFFKGE